MNANSKISRTGIIKSGRIGFVLRIAAMPIQIVIMMVLARSLGEHGLGVYFLIMSTGTVVARFAGLGLNQGVIRLVAESWKSERLGLRRLFFKLTLITCISAACASLVFGIWAGEYLGLAIFKSGEYVELSVLISIWLFFFTIQAFFSGVMEAIQKVHWATFVMTGGMLRQVGMLTLLLITLAFYTSIDVCLVTQYMLIVSIVSVIFSIYLFNQTLVVREGADHISWHKILETSLPLMMTSFAIGISREVDTFVLSYLSEESEIGYYRASARIAELALLIEGILMVVIRPYLAELIVKEQWVRLSRVANIYVIFSLAFTVPLLIVAFFWGEKLLVVLFGAGFGEGATPMVIRLVGLILLLSLGPVIPILQVSKQSSILVHSMYIGVPIQIVLTYLGTLYMGVEGTALGWVLGMLIPRLLMAISCYRQLGVKSTLDLNSRALGDAWKIGLEIFDRRV